MIKPRLGSYAVYEPSEEGWEILNEQLRQVNEDLRRQGAEVLEAPQAVHDEESCRQVARWFQAQGVDMLHALIVTWSFDHYTTLIQQSCAAPVAIRAVPGIRSGSIVGAQQLGSLLSDIEVEHRLFYGPPGHLEPAQETAIYAKAWALKKSLQGARFAFFGRRTPGMTPIAVDEVELLRRFGVILTCFGMDEFHRRAARIGDAETAAAWEKISAGARAVSCDAGSALASTRNYLALKEIIGEWGFEGVAIGSYPDCQGAMCLPIALLNDEGFAAGCEGDVNATILMNILGKLSDDPVHFGEMLDIDESENTIVSSHCGAAAPSLADEEGFILCPVRLAHSGVCIRFQSRPGTVTYANLVGRKSNYRLCAFEGEALSTGMVFEGNPLRIRLKSPFRRIWQTISLDGFGHHWMTSYQNCTPVLSEYCRLAGIRGVFPDLEGQRPDPAGR